MNKVSDVSFSISEEACLHCAGLYAAWHLSLGSYHTETHHYWPLLLRMKIIIVKFLLTITTLKIQSDYFGIKRSRKAQQIVAFSRLYPFILSHGVEMWLKIRNFSHIWSMKKSSKCVYFLACTVFRTSFFWREAHVWKMSLYIPKILEYSRPCCGSLNTLWSQD